MMPSLEQNRLVNSIENGDMICFIRFMCNEESVAVLPNALMSILKGEYVDDSTPLIVRFYRFEGEQTDIESIYRENTSVNNNVFMDSKNFEKCKNQEFVNDDVKNKLIIWEPIFTSGKSDSANVIFMQYFILVLSYLESIQMNYSIKISGGKDKDTNNGYSPLAESVFFRLRAVLSCCPKNIKNKVYILKYSNNSKQWNKLYAKIEEEEAFYDMRHMLPFIPITKETYTVLVNGTYFTKHDDHRCEVWQNIFKKLCDTYINKYLEEKYSNEANNFYKGFNNYTIQIGSVSDRLLACDQISRIKDEIVSMDKKLQKQFCSKLFYICIGIKDKMFDIDNKVVNKEIKLKLNKFLDEISTNSSNEILEICNDVQKECLIYLNKDNLLENLIYFSTILFLETANKKKIKGSGVPLEALTLRKENCTLIHELCLDYAQGVSQLIENAVVHVIASANTAHPSAEGSGILFIRIFEEDEFKQVHSIPDGGLLPDVKYFMEIYVTDLKYFDAKISSRFVNVVDKFCSNVQKYYGTEVEIKNDDVELAHMFGANGKIEYEKSALKKFYSLEKNIANHYGLQILHNVIQTSNGHLFVCSGKGDLCKYSNNKDYGVHNLDWHFGTSYAIYLPIEIGIKNEIDYRDVISNPIVAARQKVDYCEIVLNDDEFSKGVLAINSVTSKQDIVENIRASILKQITNNDAYYYIDMDKISHSIMSYEILAKAIFILIADSNTILKNVALVNFPDYYDVLRSFRQFVLFYDRNGNNDKMQHKSIYLIDSDGALDILLFGKTLEDIKENLSLGKIYGGYSESLISIITHIIARK